MIELETYLELPILNSILTTPEKILQKFFDYLIQEERYEDIILLEKLKCKILDKTIKEILDEEFIPQDYSNNTFTGSKNF